MPDGTTRISQSTASPQHGVALDKLAVGSKDAIDAIVREVLFRGQEYAIYRSDRGIYVHFSDKPEVESAQRATYVTLSAQICELRYLTSQMRPSAVMSFFGRSAVQDSIYDHNMAQALMLLMESVVQRSANLTAKADETEKEAKDIAQSALDMAVRRNTTDNTIRYVRTCVVFGILWLLAALTVYLAYAGTGEAKYYLLASATGIVGAVFSVIVRAQAFELKPCNDSGMNKLMSLIRVGMGGLAGPAFFLLLMTVSANALAGNIDLGKETTDTAGFIRMVAIIGLIGGFAERLVPNLVQSAADKMDDRTGTPGQAAQTDKKGADKPGNPKPDPAAEDPKPLGG